MSDAPARERTSSRQRRDERAPARRRLFRALIKTISEHALLAPGDTLVMRISQLSALVGRGAPKTVTLTF